MATRFASPRIIVGVFEEHLNENLVAPKGMILISRLLPSGHSLAIKLQKYLTKNTHKRAIASSSESDLDLAYRCREGFKEALCTMRKTNPAFRVNCQQGIDLSPIRSSFFEIEGGTFRLFIHRCKICRKPGSMPIMKSRRTGI